MSDAFSFHTGRTIDKYLLESLIGRGGMAEVYKSVHPDLGRELAIKVLHPHLTDTDGFIERFRREARAAASLRHPHIVQIYDFAVTEDGLYYMVMEYVEGQPLDEYLKQNKDKLPLETIQQLFLQIASAVQYAHKQGIVHRDLKPANILLDTEEQLYLADFGIAQIVGASRLTQSGTASGTPAYMAPEQVMGQTITHAVDIYALGIILYQMVTGHLPYEDDNPATMLIKQATEPPPPPSIFVPTVPSEVEKVILKSLEKDPANRFASVAEMMTALQEATTDSVVTLTESRLAPDTYLAEPDVTIPSVPEPELPMAVSPTPSPAPPAEPTKPPMWVWPIAGLAVIAVILIAVFMRDGRANEIVDVTLEPTAQNEPNDSLLSVLDATNTPQATDVPTLTPTPSPTLPPVIEGMTFIPAGSFLQGSLDGNADEAPVHEVSLDGFYMDTMEVSNADYGAFVQDHGWRPPTTWLPPDPAIWQVEATDGYLTGNYADRFRHDGVGVQAVTAVFTMSVDADNDTGFISMVFTGTIQPNETSIYTGTFRVVQTEFFNAPPSPAFREGGLADHIMMHGATGQETSQYPQVEGYIATWGFADVFLDDELLFDDYGIHVMYNDGVRDNDAHYMRRADGSCCFSPSAPADSFVDPDDPEISVWLFPSSRTPVTSSGNNEQFDDVTGGGYTIVDDWTGLYFESVEIIQAPAIPKATIPEGLEDHPVTGVSWEDAHAFCIWRSARLPTEAEWEYAARGTDNFKYPWGDDQFLVRVNARDAQAGTVPVDTLPEAASPFGLLHMAGNVWEWTADWYAPYSSSALQNPTGPTSGDLKVARGGGFRLLDFTGADEARTTHRLPLAQEITAVDVGFRCATDLP